MILDIGLLFLNNITLKSNLLLKSEYSTLEFQDYSLNFILVYFPCFIIASNYFVVNLFPD